MARLLACCRRALLAWKASSRNCGSWWVTNHEKKKNGGRAMSSSKTHFDHEKLIACQRAIQFVAWSLPLLEKLPARLAVANQLDRAATSVPLNIAEGNAKYTVPDRCRYFDNARGSALECAACLDVLVANGK